MDITTQIITKNNEPVIEKTIRSLLPLGGKILVNDLGSTDKTVEICQKYGAKVTDHPLDNDYSRLRNRLVEESKTDWQMFVRPGETILHGHKAIEKIARPSACVTVLSGGIVNREVRIWNKIKKYKFSNPVFEYLEAPTDHGINTILSSVARVDYEENMRIIRTWETNDPLASSPIYYEACMELMNQNYDRFLRLSEYYMFLEKHMSQSTTMNRYYFALVQVSHCKQWRPALQNLNLCMCHNPLMAEFWCLTGDVHYHLLSDFKKAKAFYENAIILGSRRKKTSMWPMEIAKYDEYPKKMIESCDEIMQAVYASANALSS